MQPNLFAGHSQGVGIVDRGGFAFEIDGGLGTRQGRGKCFLSPVIALLLLQAGCGARPSGTRVGCRWTGRRTCAVAAGASSRAARSQQDATRRRAVMGTGQIGCAKGGGAALEGRRAGGDRRSRSLAMWLYCGPAQRGSVLEELWSQWSARPSPAAMLCRIAESERPLRLRDERLCSDGATSRLLYYLPGNAATGVGSAMPLGPGLHCAAAAVCGGVLQAVPPVQLTNSTACSSTALGGQSSECCECRCRSAHAGGPGGGRSIPRNVRVPSVQRAGAALHVLWFWCSGQGMPANIQSRLAC